MSTTITTAATHGYAAGDSIIITRPDHRWWKRLLHRLTFQAPPVIKSTYRVSAVANSTMTIKP